MLYLYVGIILFSGVLGINIYDLIREKREGKEGYIKNFLADVFLGFGASFLVSLILFMVTGIIVSIPGHDYKTMQECGKKISEQTMVRDTEGFNGVYTARGLNMFFETRTQYIAYGKFEILTNPEIEDAKVETYQYWYPRGSFKRFIQPYAIKQTYVITPSTECFKRSDL